ncbi:unnamed protein product, partial [Medioppia subpectinata]
AFVLLYLNPCPVRLSADMYATICGLSSGLRVAVSYAASVGRSVSRSLLVFVSRSSRGLCLRFQASDLLLQNLEANGLGEKDKRQWPPPCIGRQPKASLVTLLAQVAPTTCASRVTSEALGCLYSGVPQQLRQHLSDCHIECNENQVPIEVLIKLMFNSTTKIILDNISGCVRVNTLNALMGPSGAGKTTLLKCLNGQNNRGLSDGSMIYSINNRNIRSCFIKSNVWEHLLSGLTVRQTLLYASRLKNSRITSQLNDNKIVCDLMSELVISDTADNRVETCSGGEQKRIVIACELTSHIKPNMLCIDEPTSGLDSNAAEVIINCLSDLLQRHGMTIIASIHQPNNDLFHMFDTVYVLAKGGVCLYSGVPHHLRQHLKDNGIECIENHVPIEVLLKIASKEISNKNNNNIEEKPIVNNNGVNCDQILVSNMRPVFGSLSTSKRFSFADMYYLLCRSLIHTFRCQWVSLLVQFAMMQTAALLMVYNSSSDMTEPDGCVDMGAGFDSVQTIDLIIYCKDMG